MALKIESKQVDDLIPYANNAKVHGENQVRAIASSIKEFGFNNPVLLDGDNGIIAGHGRVLAAKLIGLDDVPTIELSHLTPAQKKAYILADNRLAEYDTDWDIEMVKIEMESIAEMGLDFDLNFEDLLQAGNYSPFGAYEDGEQGSMVKEYGFAPFSVLDTRTGRWMERKKWWKSQIGDNGESREGTLSKSSLVGTYNNGVSLLDPVMAEIAFKWFGMDEGKAFDPFAGDTVFGYVCGSLGGIFTGIELRKEQADLNQARCDEASLPCTYHNDTSENMDKYIDDESQDFMFTCPPYADLEVYSDDPKDLSTMSHDEFFDIYASILKNTYAKLKQNRFAVIVVGEVRGTDGNYISLIPNTIRAMEQAGYQYYNEMIIVNAIGTLPLRAGKVMKKARKIGKHHQNFLVFLKGDAVQATKEIGDIIIHEEEQSSED